LELCLVFDFHSDIVINNSQSPSTLSSSLSTNTAYSSPNWVGSIQVSNALSQMIESKVHTTLGNAAAVAEKVVGIHSHATSANLGEERGYLVYTVRMWMVIIIFTKS
jgi:hypothetical protein